MEGALTHLDSAGRARMVDVGGKVATDRRARARAVVRMSPAAAVGQGDRPRQRGGRVGQSYTGWVR